jgi:glycosyl transferase family 25
MIGGAFYINLARRTDRLAEMETELEKLGLTAERFEAIERRPGIVGCGLSHLAVLKAARAAGLPNVLILEDDFEAVVEPAEFWAALEAFFAGPQAAEFDVLMLAYYAPHVVPVEGTELVVKVLEAQTASAYIVNARMYDRLIELYEWAMPQLAATGEHWDFANDQVWKRLQPAANWYAFKGRLGKQRASYSDTAERFHDYGV